MTLPDHVIEAGAKAIWEPVNDQPWEEARGEDKALYLVDAARVVEAALSSLWQPIESQGFPKGEEILLAEGGDVFIGYWSTLHDRWAYESGEWVQEKYTPTHWAPLLPAPQPNEEE